MAVGRSRSSIVPVLVAIGVLALAAKSLQTFVPAPVQRSTAATDLTVASSAAYAAAAGAVASVPSEVYAFGEDEDDGFDIRYLVVLALPLGAASWALFNVWRVAFRQVTRFSTDKLGTDQGVAPGD
mmetsp:Transcript_14628/g.34518  ORF Transcript_14628/g.34518 Transcript_14628/m.34518 type:complete len:126 (-) Transcript_14628:164-541(-)|eukprot:CAMPEP_0178435538 /NCGR_PEP_ID=MMETSP0689_2-20121128/33982_1 /TAXON_ID=160604 /ORGANISM="Amphidinium massartii, Strain CS-259" /LENGTH=125 /DNA_ID=CAMNT_0020057619 /DNA_START=61 /DNA_END=438 /DNA_ORIENTATION=+